jgi:hypothetical protein
MLEQEALGDPPPAGPAVHGPPPGQVEPAPQLGQELLAEQEVRLVQGGEPAHDPVEVGLDLGPVQLRLGVPLPGVGLGPEDGQAGVGPPEQVAARFLHNQSITVNLLVDGPALLPDDLLGAEGEGVQQGHSAGGLVLGHPQLLVDEGSVEGGALGLA